MSGVFGKFTTWTGGQIGYSQFSQRMQFRPGTKCKFEREGEKANWKISEAWFSPKEFDFAGINKETIDTRFKIKEDLDAAWLETDSFRRHDHVVYNASD